MTSLKTLKARFGATWDTYLARFRSDVDLFAQNGCFERRVDRLMQYELARALGTDSVIPSLSEAQDAARSARGLGLALTRTYPSSVSARFASGMFGYGWTDNLSTVAELTAYRGTLHPLAEARREEALSFASLAEGQIDAAVGYAEARLARATPLGEPERRFREDALRILRALRFSSVLGFPIEPETDAAARYLGCDRIGRAAH